MGKRVGDGCFSSEKASVYNRFEKIFYLRPIKYNEKGLKKNG